MRNRDTEAYFIEHGHPPKATGIILVDFDRTLFGDGETVNDLNRPVFEGAAEAMQSFVDAGLTVVIFTSRLSDTWAKQELGLDHAESYDMDDIIAIRCFQRDQREFIAKLLTREHIPYHTMTAEKIPAQWYVDDKAIEYRGDWGSVSERVLAA